MTARSPSLKRISRRRSSKVLMLASLNSLSYWKLDMLGQSTQRGQPKGPLHQDQLGEVGSICTVWEVSE